VETALTTRWKCIFLWQLNQLPPFWNQISILICCMHHFIRCATSCKDLGDDLNLITKLDRLHGCKLSLCVCVFSRQWDQSSQGLSSVEHGVVLMSLTELMQRCCLLCHHKLSKSR
jgi:hypothetical protein